MVLAKKRTLPLKSKKESTIESKSRGTIQDMNNEPFGSTIRSPIAVEMKKHSSNAIEVRPSEGHPKKSRIGMSKQRNFIHINTFQNHQHRHKMDSLNSDTKTP